MSSFNTYRQYDEYCGTRQDDLVRFMYENPSLAYTYDPWTNSVMTPPIQPKKEFTPEIMKKDTDSEVKKKETKPEIKKKEVIPKIKKEESSPPPSPRIEKKRVMTPSPLPTTVSTKFSWQKMFSNAWDFLKMPFEE
uniref:Uncharacterized protein n=1 Tax=viral metagenome TaxID=1070528 RepID=A0A6C0D388_9ZZZZ